MVSPSSIVVEGTLWPIVMVGAVSDPDNLERNAILLPDAVLEASPRLALGLVVGGQGSEAARTQAALLAWWRERRHYLARRTRRVAWIIQDRVLRSSTDACWDATDDGSAPVRSQMFSNIGTALRWLLDAPWPYGPRLADPRAPMETTPGLPCPARHTLLVHTIGSRREPAFLGDRS